LEIAFFKITNSIIRRGAYAWAKSSSMSKEVYGHEGACLSKIELPISMGGSADLKASQMGQFQGKITIKIKLSVFLTYPK